MTWAAAFTAEMLALKRAGHDFDKAWKVAVERHPVDTRELGNGRVAASANLFADASASDARREAVLWWQGVCRAAWDDAPAADGSPSRLKLLPGLLGAVSGTDDSTFARHAPTRGLTSGFAA